LLAALVMVLGVSLYRADHWAQACPRGDVSYRIAASSRSATSGMWPGQARQEPHDVVDVQLTEVVEEEAPVCAPSAADQSVSSSASCLILTPARRRKAYFILVR
jgi:hypothetical protein